MHREIKRLTLAPAVSSVRRRGRAAETALLTLPVSIERSLNRASISSMGCQSSSRRDIRLQPMSRRSAGSFMMRFASSTGRCGPSNATTRAHSTRAMSRASSVCGAATSGCSAINCTRCFPRSRKDHDWLPQASRYATASRSNFRSPKHRAQSMEIVREVPQQPPPVLLIVDLQPLERVSRSFGLMIAAATAAFSCCISSAGVSGRMTCMRHDTSGVPPTGSPYYD